MGKASRRKREHRAQPVKRAQHGSLAPDRGDHVAYDVLTAGGKPGLGYAFRPDENGDLHMERLEIPRKLMMATATVRHLTTIARGQPWCTKAADDALLARLDPHGGHLVVNAWKHTTEDWKRDNVRAHMMLRLRGQEEPHERILDFPSRQFGILVAAFHAHTPQGPSSDFDGVLLPEGWSDMLRKPSWAAGRSFPQVWDRANTLFWLMSRVQAVGREGVREELIARYGDAESFDMAEIIDTPHGIMSCASIGLLNEARLIVVEPEWVQGMDDFDSAREAFAFAADCHLPFDTIYLDFEGPGGNVPSLPLPRKLGLVRPSGALLWRGDNREGLHVMVMGDIASHEGKQNTHEPLGRYVFGAHLPGDDPIMRASLAIDGEMTAVEGAVVRPSALASLGADDKPTGGRIELPFGSDGAFETDDEVGALAWAEAVHTATLRALRVVWMLQAANVEMVEAKLHREGARRLKRATKRNWPIEIGLQVAVRWKKRLYLRPPGMENVGEGETIEFSHAFWVTGHPRYYPLGTRIADAMADADPSKLVEHPVKGLCRMVWQPPYVKGSRDRNGVERDPVEKVRKVVGDPYAENGEAA